MKPILVTGALGAIGTTLCGEMERSGLEVLPFDIAIVKALCS